MRAPPLGLCASRARSCAAPASSTGVRHMRGVTCGSARGGSARLGAGRGVGGDGRPKRNSRQRASEWGPPPYGRRPAGPPPGGSSARGPTTSRSRRPVNPRKMHSWAARRDLSALSENCTPHAQCAVKGQVRAGRSAPATVSDASSNAACSGSGISLRARTPGWATLERYLITGTGWRRDCRSAPGRHGGGAAVEGACRPLK